MSSKMSKSSNVQIKITNGVKLREELNLKPFFLQVSNMNQTYISQVVKCSEDKMAVIQEDFHFETNSATDLKMKVTLWEYDMLLISEVENCIIAEQEFDLGTCQDLKRTKKQSLTLQLKDKQARTHLQASMQLNVINDGCNLFGFNGQSSQQNSYRQWNG